MHHWRVDGNLMAVVERENSSPPRSLPIACQSRRDSIWHPSDCKLILSLSGYCQPTAYCYSCHFLVVWHNHLSACNSYAELVVWFFLFTQTRWDFHVCTGSYMYIYADFSFTKILLLASGFPSAYQPPIPSVIHEPSAWARAVSDVCQTGPHLSLPFVF